MFGNQIVANNFLSNYSYIFAANTDGTTLLARCVTGLGPSSSNDNSALGGLYFNESRIPNEACGSSLVQPNGAPINNLVGVINITQCGAFSTAAEGVYTCTMLNSSIMNQSIRFGIYFTGRSKLFDMSCHFIVSYYFSFLCIAAPVIDTPSSSTIKATVGSPLTLSCLSRGSPPDTFTWKKDDGPIVQSTSVTAINHTNTSAVFCAEYSIDIVTTSDNGTYTCMVANPIGNDSTAIIVVFGMYSNTYIRNSRDWQGNLWLPKKALKTTLQ